MDNRRATAFAHHASNTRIPPNHNHATHFGQSTALHTILCYSVSSIDAFHGLTTTEIIETTAKASIANHLITTGAQAT